MARRCQICGKGSKRGHNVSHSHRKTKKVNFPNLQNKRLKGKKVKVCTKCVKALARI